MLQCRVNLKFERKNPIFLLPLTRIWMSMATDGIIYLRGRVLARFLYHHFTYSRALTTVNISVYTQSQSQFDCTPPIYSFFFRSFSFLPFFFSFFHSLSFFISFVLSFLFSLSIFPSPFSHSLVPFIIFLFVNPWYNLSVTESPSKCLPRSCFYGNMIL